MSRQKVIEWIEDGLEIIYIPLTKNLKNTLPYEYSSLLIVSGELIQNSKQENKVSDESLLILKEIYENIDSLKIEIYNNFDSLYEVAKTVHVSDFNYLF